MQIEHGPCPRCGNPRIVRLRKELSMCCNCKLQWSPSGRATAKCHLLAPEAACEHPYAFTLAELSRLACYRAAVAAGFYTDALPEGEPEPRGRGRDAIARSV
jgi:hypothetical protein